MPVCHCWSDNVRITITWNNSEQVQKHTLLVQSSGPERVCVQTSPLELRQGVLISDQCKQVHFVHALSRRTVFQGLELKYTTAKSEPLN